MARPPAKTDRMFRRAEPDPRTLTSERIADHLAAFEASGGRIEVLGVTHVLKKIADVAAPTAPSPTSAQRGTR